MVTGASTVSVLDSEALPASKIRLLIAVIDGLVPRLVC